MADYPVELEREVALRDGARIRIRPIRGEDESRLVRMGLPMGDMVGTSF